MRSEQGVVSSGLGWKPILLVTGDEVSGLLIANPLAGSQYQNTHHSPLTTQRLAIAISL